MRRRRAGIGDGGRAAGGRPGLRYAARGSVACLVGLLWAASAGLAAAQGAATVAPSPVTTVDTGLGFTIAVPASWARGQPSGNNKFVIGNPDEDFAAVVADLGPAQADAAAAKAVYLESFARSGLALVSEADATVAGRPAKRLVFSFETPAGAGHAEAVIVTAGDESYAVLVITPAAALEARRPAIARILESIALKP